MKLQVLGIVVGAALIGPLGASAAVAQDYPAREIHMVSGFAPGSGADIMTRYFADKLQALAGKPVIVENTVGAGGNLAHTYVAKSKPDGYTVYPVGGSALASSVHLFKEPPLDPVKDLEPVGTLLKQGWFLAVDAKSPFKTLPELTAFLKDKRGKGSYASSTATGNVMGELYKSIAGLETVQVNYRTMPDAVNDLLAGTIDFLASDAPFTMAQVRAGRLRALATSTPERMTSVPNVPTFAEGGVKGISLTVWWLTELPAGTPKPIADKLGAWMNQILRMDETRKFLADIGTDVFISTPDQAKAFLAQEIKTWGDYVRLAKIEPQ